MSDNIRNGLGLLVVAVGALLVHLLLRGGYDPAAEIAVLVAVVAGAVGLYRIGADLLR